jgi:LuxR family transcriptional regulator, maltose regulon positive regulatory protein
VAVAAVSLGVPILTAKITAPAIPAWAVQRPRITRLIADGTRWCSLTVVSGPPGAGKTTALALWAEAEPGAVAWVGLDEFDDRSGVFWRYVIAALRRSGVAAPETLPATTPGPAADHEFLLRLAAALAAQDPMVTLVIDDLHLLTDPAVFTGLDFLLRNVGPGLRLLVSSRMDPLLPLHRYRLAGQLAEIRASDLAFTTSEADQLLAQHGQALPADSLECLTRRTEGWAAGLRLAAISMGTHPDPDLFVKELITDDSALTSYLVGEVLNAQAPRTRDMLLSTSILEDVSAEAASELTGDGQAAAILPALARTNAFVQPIGRGRYRYHPLLGEVLRLKLKHQYPNRVALLHRRAAQWYERNGQLLSAVRHAIEAGDRQLAASMVIDKLAIGEITAPRDGHCLADEFQSMPHGQSWTEPEPYLVCAAVALSAGREESAIAALNAADSILDRLPDGEQTASRLAAAMVRLAISLRAGDHSAAAAAAARAEILVSKVPGDMLARHPEIRAHVLFGHGAADLGSGRLDEAAHVLDLAVGAATGSGGDRERAHCLGHLALVEALRGQLRHAAKLAAQATAAHADQQQPPAQHPNPAALVALAWVHLERNELRETHRRLEEADSALGVNPDKLISTVARLAAAGAALADGRAAAAVQIIARARSEWSPPAWLEHRLSLTVSQAHAMAGDIQTALAAAEHGGHGSLESAAAIAHAWMAAGNGHNARRALAPVLATGTQAPERVRLQAWLVDAQLSYSSSDGARGHRSLASALRLAQREQLRLPFAIERGWIEPVLRRDPVLAGAHQRLFAPAPHPTQLPAPAALPDQATALIEPLTEREREVLRHVARLLDTTEIASEMYISINTVKTHMKSIHRKLAATRRSDAVRRARELQLI